MINSDKIFIPKWLVGILLGTVCLALGVVGFFESYMEIVILFTLLGVCLPVWYIAFIPHSFLFDNEKITAVYAFKKKSIKYAHIKSCIKGESGVRNYPFGEYYQIISDKPFWQELNIPSTKKIDKQISNHITMIKERY